MVCMMYKNQKTKQNKNKATNKQNSKQTQIAGCQETWHA